MEVDSGAGPSGTGNGEYEVLLRCVQKEGSKFSTRVSLPPLLPGSPLQSKPHISDYRHLAGLTVYYRAHTPC